MRVVVVMLMRGAGGVLLARLQLIERLLLVLVVCVGLKAIHALL